MAERHLLQPCCTATRRAGPLAHARVLHCASSTGCVDLLGFLLQEVGARVTLMDLFVWLDGAALVVPADIIILDEWSLRDPVVSCKAMTRLASVALLLITDNAAAATAWAERPRTTLLPLFFSFDELLTSLQQVLQ